MAARLPQGMSGRVDDVGQLRGQPAYIGGPGVG